MNIPSTHASLFLALRRTDRGEAAWAAFQARYRDVILTWCRRRDLADDCAEDVTQEVLLKLYQELPRGTYDPAQGRFRSWLKAVVNNALTDCWRRRQRRAEGAGVGGTAFLERLAGLAGPEAADELSDVIVGHANAGVAEVLERVRRRLKPTTWQAFHQVVVEERPSAEVARELGLSILTVYQAAYRVKQMFLREYDGAPPDDREGTPLPG